MTVTLNELLSMVAPLELISTTDRLCMKFALFPEAFSVPPLK